MTLPSSPTYLCPRPGSLRSITCSQGFLPWDRQELNYLCLIPPPPRIPPPHLVQHSLVSDPLPSILLNSFSHRSDLHFSHSFHRFLQPGHFLTFKCYFLCSLPISILCQEFTGKFKKYDPRKTERSPFDGISWSRQWGLLAASWHMPVLVYNKVTGVLLTVLLWKSL